jgi:parvulin-like peptidyl-prolyl isomerase
LYARFKRFQSKPSSLPADQLRSTIEQGAQGEADKMLLANAAAQEGIAATDSAVNAQLERYFQSRGGKEKFVEMVEQQGFTLEFVENDVRTQLGIQQYVNNYLETQMAVSEEELKAAYEADKTATVRHILFKTQGKTDEEKDQVKKNAQDVLARAKAGEDFAALATEFTEDPGSQEKGGLYENFPKGRMVPEFEEASFTLPIGAISDLVETAYGYHIIKIVDRQKETKPFEEVKEQLENQLKQKNRRTAYDTLIDDLKEKANYTEHFDVLG